MTQKHTPLMQQYHEIKAQYPDALLLFQVGDFYELFFDDAKKTAAFLGIALTARGKNKGEPIPLCGVPIHARDHYLHKLVKGGFKVVICDQLEEPKPGKVVKRGVTQVLSPGTLTDEKLLDERSASYLFSFYPTENSWGLLFAELLTGQLFATSIAANSEKLLESELVRFFPDEVLIPSNEHTKELQKYFKKQGYFTTVVHDEEQVIQENKAAKWIEDQFPKNIQKAVNENEAIKLALYYFYAYICKNQQSALDQFNTIFFYTADDFLILDAATQRNLELIKNAQDGSRKNTLFETIDRAKTSMGSRMIKKWIQRPLVKKDAIIQRQDIVALFSCDISLSNQLEQLLHSVGDIERVIGRIALQRALVFDYHSLSKALRIIPEIKKIIHNKKEIVLLSIISNHIDDFYALSDLLTRSLHDDPSKDRIIKDGFDEKLDRLRQLVDNSNKNIIDLERKEQQETGIQSLKIRFNQVQGYYIEVTKANLSFVPDYYKRVQTLVGRERFTTPQLQQLHYEIEQARTQINAYEAEIFEKIKQSVFSYISSLRKCAHALAHLDALLGIARIAYDYKYIRPTFNKNRDIIIKNGRHPVVEQKLIGNFIPNDTQLTNEQSLWIITGPNMGGKSTYLRQVALICVMAHIGSFVPAESADIALLDRIFTRLGASDNVAEGKSTFLVEMEETATICTQATENSLVILDEVGRGTSTFDGLAIAQAVVEYLFTHTRSRCLFATHYHELTQLQKTTSGIVSYHAASKKTETGIIFLYKIIRGIADGSFGIDVARLVELPSHVINRAQELAKQFEGGEQINCLSQEHDYKKLMQENYHLKAQLNSMQQDITNEKKYAALLNSINFDTLSPKKAFDLLWALHSNDNKINYEL